MGSILFHSSVYLIREVVFSLAFVCVFIKLRERRLCTPSTWWKLGCRTRDPQDPLLESWCTRTALTVLRRCFATRVSLASIEVGQKCSTLTFRLSHPPCSAARPLWPHLHVFVLISNFPSSYFLLLYRTGSSAYRCGTWEGYQTHSEHLPSHTQCTVYL